MNSLITLATLATLSSATQLNAMDSNDITGIEIDLPAPVLRLKENAMELTEEDRGLLIDLLLEEDDGEWEETSDMDMEEVPELEDGSGSSYYGKKYYKKPYYKKPYYKKGYHGHKDKKVVIVKKEHKPVVVVKKVVKKHY